MSIEEQKAKLRERFIKERGFWSATWDPIMEMDHKFFENYLNFSAHMWKHGPLEPKVKEFIYIAIDVATTHLYTPGLRSHIRNALKRGATKEEIMEVIELTCQLGIHAATTGVPILVEEYKKFEKETKAQKSARR